MGMKRNGEHMLRLRPLESTPINRNAHVCIVISETIFKRVRGKHPLLISTECQIFIPTDYQINAMFIWQSVMPSVICGAFTGLLTKHIENKQLFMSAFSNKIIRDVRNYRPIELMPLKCWASIKQGTKS
jgi:hypothetical protein